MRKDIKNMDLTNDDEIQEGYAVDNKTLKKIQRVKEHIDKHGFEGTYVSEKREEK